MPDRPEQDSQAALPFLPYGKQEISDADVKAVVEAHGGRVMVQSTEGAGSEFTVSLPV